MAGETDNLKQDTAELGVLLKKAIDHIENLPAVQAYKEMDEKTLKKFPEVWQALMSHDDVALYAKLTKLLSDIDSLNAAPNRVNY